MNTCAVGIVLLIVLAQHTLANTTFDRLACLRDSSPANITLCASCARALAPLPCSTNECSACDACELAISTTHEMVMLKVANDCRICDTLKNKFGFTDSTCAPFCYLPECIMPASGSNISDRAAACYAALHFHCPVMFPMAT